MLIIKLSNIELMILKYSVYDHGAILRKKQIADALILTYKFVRLGTQIQINRY